MWTSRTSRLNTTCHSVLAGDDNAYKSLICRQPSVSMILAEETHAYASLTEETSFIRWVGTLQHASRVLDVLEAIVASTQKSKLATHLTGWSAG